MTTSIAAKGIEVIIGTQDWSDWVTEFTTGYTELDDGAIETQATLTLAIPANFNQLPSDPRYETNPIQWARGQLVQVQVLNDSGIFVDHPCGKLFIIEEPEAAQINSELTLNLGCALLLNNFRAPDDDLSGVAIGVATPRHTVIGRVLDAAQVPHSLTPMGDSFDYPVPKRGGSYVEQAGVLARADNQVIYCDRTGIARNAPLDFAQTAFATFTIGEDETLWEPSKGSEIPVEELCVSGVTYDLIDPNIGSTFVKIEYVSEGEINPAASNPNRQVIGERTTITTFGYNPSDRTQRIETFTQRPIITIEPPPTGSSVGYNAILLVPAQSIEEVEKFDSLGRLEEKTITTKDPVRSFNSADPSRALSTSRVETSAYSYTSDEVLSRISTVIQEASIKVNPETANPLTPVFSEDSLKTWDEAPANSRIWIATERYRIAQRRVNPAPSSSSIGYNAYLPISDPSKEDLWQRGTDLAPPSVIYRNPDRSQKERHIKACATFAPLAGSGFSERKRSISIEGATSEAQLYAYAIAYNRLIIGRRLGRRIGFRLSDLWLSAGVRPLLRIDVLWQSATYKLLIDGLTYSHMGNEAYAIANCILIESNGVQIARPLLTAKINAACGECVAAIEAETSGNTLNAVCGSCSAAIDARLIDSPGAIDSRFNKPENSITLGVI